MSLSSISLSTIVNCSILKILFKSLIVAWVYRNWGLTRNNMYLINEFEADLEKMIIAEIQLHKEVNDENKRYWLIDEIEFEV